MTSGEPRALLADASRAWVRRAPWVVAFVLCAALLPTTIRVLDVTYEMGVGFASALAVAQTAPLLLAVVRPLRAWSVILTADVVGALALLAVDFDPRLPWPFPATVLVGYVGLSVALGLREPRRTLLLVWLTTAAVNVGLVFLAPHPTGAAGMLLTMLSGVALLVARALRERRDAQLRLAEQETISEAERGRRTLLEERARIARELHDVVAHHMSVITVQADTAAYRLDGVPPPAQDEFASIAATARASLGEMRRLLGVLRDEETPGELAPQPGPDQIGRLADATARAGVPVELAVQDVEVPETVGVTAYRIVQEALANVVRHAPGAPTRVGVAQDGTGAGARLVVLVVNGPPPGPPAAPLEDRGGGQGLVGMRERVRLAGGSLDVGPLPDGGFRVAARLPLLPE